MSIQLELTISNTKDIFIIKLLKLSSKQMMYTNNKGKQIRLFINKEHNTFIYQIYIYLLILNIIKL